MNSSKQVLRPSASRGLVLAVLAAALLAAGCGEKKDRLAGPAAAKVNGDEIAVQQISSVLQQQRNLSPEQTDAASKQILERLIDQQLALQKADELKIDRDPRVMHQIEAARREILARAYLDKVGEGAAKPAPEDIKKYYDEKPALFSQRRIYSIQEIVVEAKPEQVAPLRERLGESRNIAEFVAYLKDNDFRFSGNQAVRAAEQFPPNSLNALSRMSDGQAMLLPAASGVQVVVLAGSRSQPLTEEQARPAIEQLIANERKRKLVEEDLKALRAAAKIEYVGQFAEGGTAAAAAAASAGDAAKAPESK
jgi:EpsD family peptidyl-prolyl cis-trans isomerase